MRAYPTEQDITGGMVDLPSIAKMELIQKRTNTRSTLRVFGVNGIQIPRVDICATASLNSPSDLILSNTQILQRTLS